MYIRFVAVLSVALLAGCVAQQSAPAVATPIVGDSLRGGDYAKAACAQCHAVAAGDMASPNLSAPSFAELAETPGLTSIAVNAWLHAPHQDMPDLIIPQDRIDDLSAYILSLKPAGNASTR